MITDDQLDELKHAVLGTADNAETVCERLGIDAGLDEAEDRLLDVNVETCAKCGWWFESCMLHDSREVFGFVCDECEPEDDD